MTFDPRQLRRGWARCLMACVLTGVQGLGTAMAADDPARLTMRLPRPATDVNALPRLTLSSYPGGTALPFTLGQPLRQGQVPAGSVLVAEGGHELQFVVKNRWPDGSAKFAIVSGFVDLEPRALRNIALKLKPQAEVAGIPVSTAVLRHVGMTARVDFGDFGSASWSVEDWRQPAQQLVYGPQMSAWVYRKPIGRAAHLVAWLEVRVYKNGRVEVMPWIENGYLNVPGPAEKTATATFTLGGTERFSQPLALLNHQRAVLAGPTKLTHWFNGTDPQITPRHDTAYFMATRLVPNYVAVTPTNSPLYNRLPSEYTPLMQGSYHDAMGTTGYHPSIGLLPEWDVAYLSTQGDPRAYRGVIINAYAAGRYGIHYRDEKTHRPLVFASYPNLVMRTGSGISDTGSSSKDTYTPVASGAMPPQFKTSHHPSMGYMAYLLTGWNYFMEETQLLATANFVKHSDKTRGFSQGLYLSGADAAQTRSSAWAIRTLAQAATITPDDDPLRAQFIESVGNNVIAYHKRYVAQPNNPLGMVEGYSPYSVAGDWYVGAPWMDDFLTAALAYAKELRAHAPAIQPRLDAFLTWKFRSVTGRLGGGGEDEFAYTHGAQYNLPFAKAKTADWKNGTGPWFSSWGELARALGIPTGIAAGAALETGYPTAASGYWGNLMPALSYAVDMEAAGAAEGWARVRSASNYPALRASFNDHPVWSVAPR